MPRQQSYVSGLTGRRSYYRFLFGSHYWAPLTENSWVRGIVRDTPRSAIPPGGVYDSIDYLLHQPGFAQKRGGTSYLTPTLNGTPISYLTTASYAAAVGYAEYPTGAQVVVIGSDGTLAGIPIVNGGFSYNTNQVVSADLGSRVYATKDKPKFRVGGSKNLLIITSADGSAAPKTYDGTKVATLGGSPPKGRFAELYKTRLVLGNVPGHENRLYFSPTPDITSSWDTTNSWIDCDHQITGLAALNNVLLIFSNGNLERIIGTTPPPGSDMDRAPLASTGCTDARSIVVKDGIVYFANPKGVFYTNGAGVQSLTEHADNTGISAYWQQLFSGYDPNSWTVTAGIFGSFYVVSILNNNAALVDTLMCYLPRQAWWRLRNVNAAMFAAAHGAREELYYADRSTAKAVTMSGIFQPASSNKNDANGNAVQPSIEFRPAGYSATEKRYGAGLLTYDMRDAATDTPYLSVTVKTGAEADVSSVPAESPLPAVTANNRKRFTLAKESQALTVRLDQTGPSAKTEVYSLEVEQRQMPYSDLDSPA